MIVFVFLGLIFLINGYQGNGACLDEYAPDHKAYGQDWYDDYNWIWCDKNCEELAKSRYCTQTWAALYCSKSPSLKVQDTCKNACNQCPIDCQWDEWNVGQCSKTCGGGTRKNTRNKIVYEKNGGTCSDSSPSQMKAEDCNPQPCPGDVFVIDTQKQFNEMKNDNNGAYLANIFNDYDTVKIHTKDRNWKRHIYLPHLYAKKAKVIVQRDSTYDVHIHGPGIGEVKVPKKTTWTFRNKNGNWKR